MQVLLQYGASMEQDGYGMTPLLSASVTGHTNIVEYLTMHEQVRSPLTCTHMSGQMYVSVVMLTF